MRVIVGEMPTGIRFIDRGENRDALLPTSPMSAEHCTACLCMAQGLCVVTSALASLHLVHISSLPRLARRFALQRRPEIPMSAESNHITQN